MVKELQQVLDHSHGVRVLFFNGQFDIICNHIGVEKGEHTRHDELNPAPALVPPPHPPHPPPHPPHPTPPPPPALNGLNWKGASEFRTAAHSVWTGAGKDGRPKGYVSSAGPLSLLLVLGSGHMVPMDKPEDALDMLHRFIKSKSFADGNNTLRPKRGRRNLMELDAAGGGGGGGGSHEGWGTGNRTGVEDIIICSH